MSKGNVLATQDMYLAGQTTVSGMSTTDYIDPCMLPIWIKTKKKEEEEKKKCSLKINQNNLFVLV